MKTSRQYNATTILYYFANLHTNGRTPAVKYVGKSCTRMTNNATPVKSTHTPAHPHKPQAQPNLYPMYIVVGFQSSFSQNDGNLLSIAVGSSSLSEGWDDVDEAAVVLHSALSTAGLLLFLFLGVNLDRTNKVWRNITDAKRHVLQVHSNSGRMAI